MMDPYGGPAALGGVMTGLMLAAWMLGRWQSGLGTARGPGGNEALREPVTATPDARPCETAARAERRDVINAFSGLGELHADVSAYRQAQRILSDSALRGSMQDGWSASGEGDICRFIGVSGEPTCPATRASTDPLGTCAVCDAAPPVPAAMALPALAQPCVEPVVFTRV